MKGSQTRQKINLIGTGWEEIAGENHRKTNCAGQRKANDKLKLAKREYARLNVLDAICSTPYECADRQGRRRCPPED